VVIAEEVEEPMSKEEAEFFVQGLADLGGLFARTRNGDDELAEIRGIFQAEGEYVGGAVFFAIGFVERVDLFVCGEQEFELGLSDFRDDFGKRV
jgi:hypothetical protein